MKYFISQPMNGKSSDEIKEARREIENALLLDDNDGEIIDSFFENAPVDAKPLWYLGESLKKLADADIAYFAKGWSDARGCVIEHDCALAYGITVIEDNN